MNLTAVRQEVYNLESSVVVKELELAINLALYVFTMRFSLTLCYFVLVFFSPFSIAITSLEEERANLSAFRTFVPVALV